MSSRFFNSFGTRYFVNLPKFIFSNCVSARELSLGGTQRRQGDIGNRMSSWFWVGVIVVGGALVVIGNIQYARAKDTEDKQNLVSAAREVISPELERNRNILAMWRTTLEQDAIPFQQFEVSAWGAISQGDMLASFQPSELRAYTRIYEELLKANSTQQRLMELAVGTASALSDAVQHKKYLVGNLQTQLNEIEAALKETK
jgi:hypothetical protein